MSTEFARTDGPAPGAQEARLRQAGRGFLFITGAKVYFLITATFTSLAFPRLFGDPVAFGGFRVVSGLLNVFTMVVITATVQAASKLASEAGADPRSVRRAAFRVQTAVFGPVFLGLLALGGLIAEGFLSDGRLALPLRIASIVVLAYTYYAVLVGLVNGATRYGAQAGLDVTFSTLKTALMVALVVATGSVAWAFAGFATAAVVVLAVAAFVVRLPAATAGAATGTGLERRFLGYLLPLAGYALVLNLLLQADVVAIKASFGGGFGFGGTEAADAASFAAGVYGAAKNVALLPYSAVISIAFVVFPMVSRSSSTGDKAAVASAASGAIRLSALLSAAAVAFLGAAPDVLLRVLFGEAYAGAGHVLVPLLAAGGLLALMYVGNAVLASAGHPGVSLAGGAAAVGIQILALFALLGGNPDQDTTWWSATAATLAGSGLGALLSLYLLRRVSPAAGWLPCVIGAAASAAVALFSTGLLPDSLPGLARPFVATAIFLMLLPVTRAVRLAEVARIAQTLRRR